MVFFNYALRKLNAKIVYYGPGLCGKTTNLQWIHDHLEGGQCGKMVSLATEGDRTIFFDLLPLDIGTIRGMEVTLQLYTVPGQVHYNATRQLVLRGADGVVFVADSQRAMLDSNRESWSNLKDNLRLQGVELPSFPHVIQFNKRDLRDIVPVEDLDEALNEYSSPIFEAVALQGIGVQDTLESIVKLVMRSLRDRYEVLTGRSARPKRERPVEGAKPVESGPRTPERSGPWPAAAPPAADAPPPQGEPDAEIGLAAEVRRAEEGAVTHPVLEGEEYAGELSEQEVPPPPLEFEHTGVYDTAEGRDLGVEANEPEPDVETPFEHTRPDWQPEQGVSAWGVEDDLAAAEPVREEIEELAEPEELSFADEVAAAAAEEQAEAELTATAAGEVWDNAETVAEPESTGRLEHAGDEEELGGEVPEAAEEWSGRNAPTGVEAVAKTDPWAALAEVEATAAVPHRRLSEAEPPPAEVVEQPFATAAEGPPASVQQDAPAAETEAPVAAAEVRAAETAGEDEPFAAEPVPEEVTGPVGAEEALALQEPDPFGAPPETGVPAPHPAAMPAAPAGSVFMVDEGDPFAEPFPESEVQHVRATASAVVEPAVGLVPAGVQLLPGDNQLQVRLEGTGALAESGSVRELDIVVPVPGGWIGNRRVTLQLRLTLTPATEASE